VATQEGVFSGEERSLAVGRKPLQDRQPAVKPTGPAIFCPRCGAEIRLPAVGPTDQVPPAPNPAAPASPGWVPWGAPAGAPADPSPGVGKWTTDELNGCALFGGLAGMLVAFILRAAGAEGVAIVVAVVTVVVAVVAAD
jgi:hypothetical protein